MSLILRAVALIIGLIVSAHTKFHGIPVLWLLAAITFLAVIALILYLVHRILQERQQPAPQPVYVVTTAP